MLERRRKNQADSKKNRSANCNHAEMRKSKMADGPPASLTAQYQNASGMTYSRTLASGAPDRTTALIRPLAPDRKTTASTTAAKTEQRRAAPII